MKQEIQDKIQENAVGLLDFVSQSKDFILEQAPIYVQELVQLHFIDNISSLIIKSILLLLCLVLTVSAISKRNEMIKSTTSCEVVDAICECTLRVGALLILAISFLSNGIKKDAVECYKAKYAPRVLIIEKLNKEIR